MKEINSFRLMVVLILILCFTMLVNVAYCETTIYDGEVPQNVMDDYDTAVSEGKHALLLKQVNGGYYRLVIAENQLRLIYIGQNNSYNLKLVNSDFSSMPIIEKTYYSSGGLISEKNKNTSTKNGIRSIEPLIEELTTCYNTTFFDTLYFDDLYTDTDYLINTEYPYVSSNKPVLFYNEYAYDYVELNPEIYEPPYTLLVDNFKNRAKMRGNAVVKYVYTVNGASYTQYFETKVFKNLTTGSNEPSMKYQIFTGDNSNKKYHVFWSYVSRMDWNGIIHDDDYSSNPLNPVGENREFVHIEEGSQSNEPISNPVDKTPDEDFNIDLEPNEFIDVYMVNKVAFGDDEYIEMDAYNLNIIDMGKALSHQRMKQYEFKVDFQVSTPITIEQVKLDGEPLTSASNFECNTAGQGSFTFKRYLTRDLSTNVAIELPTMEYDWDFILRDSHSINTPLPDDYEEKPWYDKLMWHIDNMFAAIQKVFGMIPVLIGGVGTAVKTLFSFLPAEWNTLILIGIGAGVIKAIKG